MRIAVISMTFLNMWVCVFGLYRSLYLNLIDNKSSGFELIIGIPRADFWVYVPYFLSMAYEILERLHTAFCIWNSLRVYLYGYSFTGKGKRYNSLRQGIPWGLFLLFGVAWGREYPPQIIWINVTVCPIIYLVQVFDIAFPATIQKEWTLIDKRFIRPVYIPTIT